jgi:hypothetical protein
VPVGLEESEAVAQSVEEVQGVEEAVLQREGVMEEVLQGEGVELWQEETVEEAEVEGE